MPHRKRKRPSSCCFMALSCSLLGLPSRLAAKPAALASIDLSSTRSACAVQQLLSVCTTTEAGLCEPCCTAALALSCSLLL